VRPYGSALRPNTPKVIIDHTTWFNIGTTDPREIILGDGRHYSDPDDNHSILSDQVATGNTRVFINIKDSDPSSDSYMGTIMNICFWNIDKMAFYMHSVLDTIRMDPQFADTANYDFTLPAGSPLLTFGTDGKPIGDPRWGTNYVGTVKPDNANLPTRFTLAPVYPNPFNPTANINFSLPLGSQTKLAIYDLRGNEVSRILNAYLEAGEHHFAFDGSHLKSGIYFCRLTAAGQTISRKMVLLK
jgi:hypothetical protein